MAVSTRTRFEVFKRDGFTCQYCGRTPEADGIKLHVDHMIPRANGGGDDAGNLVTACQDCNLGKSSVPLKAVKLPDASDQANRLAELARAEENRIIYAKVIAEAYDLAMTRWESWWNGRPTYPYPNAIKAWIRDFGTHDVLESIDKACDKCDHSIDAVKYLAGIYRNKKADAQAAQTICLVCDCEVPEGTYLCEGCSQKMDEERARFDTDHDAASVAGEDEIAYEVAAWDSLAEAAGF